MAGGVSLGLQCLLLSPDGEGGKWQGECHWVYKCLLLSLTLVVV